MEAFIAAWEVVHRWFDLFIALLLGIGMGACQGMEFVMMGLVGIFYYFAVRLTASLV